MTARAHSRRTRTPILRRALACGALGAALLACAGCAATTVDVYVPTSQTSYAADGSATRSETFTLDERGNAVATDVESAAGAAAGDPGPDTAQETAYDLFGVPIPLDGSCEVEVDGQGQPTRIVRTDATGEKLWTRTLAYRDVKGRLASEACESADLSWSVSYDRDGWPLRATLAAGGTEVEVEFVYEIDEVGVVTRQLAVAQGTEIASWSYEYDENMQVATVRNADGTATAYEYELVADPSAYAMARALVHEPDMAELAGLLGLQGAGGTANPADGTAPTEPESDADRPA